MKAPPPSSARLPAVIPAPQMELVRQYEEQIHAAQLEREKRKLQIANLKSELAKRSQSRQAALARRAEAIQTSPAAEAEDSPHAEGRVMRDLASADRRLVRNVLLRELGGENYVPPNIKNLSGPGVNESSARGAARVIGRCGDRTHREISYHIVPGYTFCDLLKDVCDFFGVPQDNSNFGTAMVCAGLTQRTFAVCIGGSLKTISL